MIEPCYLFVSMYTDLVHVRAGVLVEFVAGGEDDERYLTVTQNGQLVRFLHHAKLTLIESYLK